MEALLGFGVAFIVLIGMLEAGRVGPSHTRRLLGDRATHHGGSFDDPELRGRAAGGGSQR